MVGSNTECPNTDLRELFETMCQLMADSARVEELVQAMTVHPASRVRLKWACASVLRSWSTRRELMADVMQEATCQVIQRIRAGRVRFAPESPERLSGWLWTIWRNACRDAWRRDRSASMPTTRISAAAAVATPPTSAVQDDLLAEMLLEIQQIQEPLLRQVMMDWAAGMSGVESARTLGRSKSWVSKIRRRGLAQLRARLSES